MGVKKGGNTISAERTSGTPKLSGICNAALKPLGSKDDAVVVKRVLLTKRAEMQFPPNAVARCEKEI